MHKDSIKPGQKVLVVDDLIATGGTTEAMIKLIESLGGEVVGVVVLMEHCRIKGQRTSWQLQTGCSNYIQRQISNNKNR